MWPPRAQLRVWLHRRPTDLRKSFDGLAALVKHELGDDPSNGALYVFTNRMRSTNPVFRHAVELMHGGLLATRGGRHGKAIEALRAPGVLARAPSRVWIGVEY